MDAADTPLASNSAAMANEVQPFSTASNNAAESNVVAALSTPATSNTCGSTRATPPISKQLTGPFAFVEALRNANPHEIDPAYATEDGTDGGGDEADDSEAGGSTGQDGRSRVDACESSVALGLGVQPEDSAHAEDQRAGAGSNDDVRRAEKAQEELEELQIKALFSLIEEIPVTSDGHHSWSKLLFLTNKQASMFKIDSVGQFCLAMGIQQRPQFIINLQPSLATIGAGARYEAHWSSRRHLLHPDRSGSRGLEGLQSTTEYFELDGIQGLVDTDRRIAIFLRECVLPLAKRTHALVILSESNYCSLSRAFGMLCNAEAAKSRDGTLPFTVLHIGMAEKYLSATAAPHSIVHQLYSKSQRWQHRLDKIKRAVSQYHTRGPYECQWTRAETDPPSGCSHYIIVDNVTMQEEGPQSQRKEHLDWRPAEQLAEKIMQQMASELTSITIATLHSHGGYPVISQRISNYLGRGLPVLLLDSRDWSSLQLDDGDEDDAGANGNGRRMSEMSNAPQPSAWQGVRIKEQAAALLAAGASAMDSARAKAGAIVEAAESRSVKTHPLRGARGGRRVSDSYASELRDSCSTVYASRRRDRFPALATALRQLQALEARLYEEGSCNLYTTSLVACVHSAVQRDMQLLRQEEASKLEREAFYEQAPGTKRRRRAKSTSVLLGGEAKGFHLWKVLKDLRDADAIEKAGAARVEQRAGKASSERKGDLQALHEAAAAAMMEMHGEARRHGIERAAEEEFRKLQIIFDKMSEFGSMLERNEFADIRRFAELFTKVSVYIRDRSLDYLSYFQGGRAAFRFYWTTSDKVAEAVLKERCEQVRAEANLAALAAPDARAKAKASGKAGLELMYPQLFKAELRENANEEAHANFWGRSLVLNERILEITDAAERRRRVQAALHAVQNAIREWVIGVELQGWAPADLRGSEVWATSTYVNMLTLLDSPIAFSGNVGDIEGLRGLLAKQARINRLPDFNGLQTMEILKTAWDKVDIFARSAAVYKRATKLLYVLMLVISFSVTSVTIIGLNVADTNADEYWHKQHLDVTVVALTLCVSVLTTTITFLNPATKWQQLRGAALALESEIWKFRTRSGVYSMDASRGHGSQLASKHAERQLQEYVEQLNKHVLKSATVLDTDFLSRFDGIFTDPRKHHRRYTHGQYPDAGVCGSYGVANSATQLEALHKREQRKKGHVGSRERSEVKLEDDHHSPLTPEEFLELRVRPQLEFYQKRLPRYWKLRMFLEVVMTVSTLAGTILAFVGYGSWAGITAAAVTSFSAYAKFHGTQKKLERFSDSIAAIDGILIWWRSLDVEKANLNRIGELVDRCEQTFQSERQSWVSTSMAVQLLSGGAEDDTEKGADASGAQSKVGVS